MHLTTFVKFAPAGGDGGLEPLGMMFFWHGGVLEYHVHEVRYSEIATDLDGGGVIPGLDLLLGRAQLVDALHHPVVRDGIPNVLLVGYLA